MSRHVLHGATELVVGWDPPLQSFFYQLHDYSDPEYEGSPVLWSGADGWPDSAAMLEDLEREAADAGLDLPADYDRALLVRALDEDRMVSP